MHGPKTKRIWSTVLKPGLRLEVSFPDFGR